MRNRRNRKFKHYGPFPVNEYGFNIADETPADPEKDTPQTDSADSADGAAEDQLQRRKTGRGRFSGWTRPWHGKRRSEAPVREDEFTDERRTLR